MTIQARSMTVVCLVAALSLSPVTSLAQGATTFSGRAISIGINAVGVSLALSDTGPLPATGGNLQTSLLNISVLGLVSAEALSSSTSGSGSSSQSRSVVAAVNLLGGLVAADVVRAQASAECSSGSAATTGSSEIVNLVVAGTPIVVLNPNLAISLPGGISVVINEQTSSSGGNTGSMTVNAIHVTGPSIDIVVSSAQAGVTCTA